MFYAITNKNTEEVVAICPDTVIVICKAKIPSAISGQMKDAEVFIIHPAIPPISTEEYYAQPMDDLPPRFKMAGKINIGRRINGHDSN